MRHPLGHAWGRGREKGWVYAILFLAILCAAAPAASQAPGPKLEIRVGFQGAFRHGARTPVIIDVGSAAGVRGEVELAVPRNDLFSAAQSFVTVNFPVALHPGEERRFWLTVPLVGSPYPLTATLSDTSGRPLVTEEAHLRGEVVDGPIFLVLDPAGSAWRWLRELAPTPGPQPDPQRLPHIAHARQAADVPWEWSAFSSLAGVIVKDSFPLHTLGKEQIDAITLYVRGGGHLILTGGSSPPALPISWLAWLPELTGRVTSSALAADVSVPIWQVEQAASLHPLAPISKRVGSGRVTLFPYDPSVTQAGPDIRQIAAEHVLSPSGDERWQALSEDDLWRLLAAAELTFGGGAPLALGLTGYVFVVAALLMFSQKRPLALLALVPAIGLATWGAATYVQRTGLSDQWGYAEVQLVHGLPEGMAHYRSYTLAVSFGSDPATVSVLAPKPLPFPAPVATALDIHARLDEAGLHYAVDQTDRSLRLVHEGLTRLGIDLMLTKGPDRRLRLINRSPFDLKHVFYIDGRRLTQLRDVPAGGISEWGYPPEPLPGFGWVGVNLQSQLSRRSPRERPDDLSIRLLSFVADHGAGTSLRNTPFVVALLAPEPLLNYRPAGRTSRWRVLILPLQTESSLPEGAADVA